MEITSLHVAMWDISMVNNAEFTGNVIACCHFTSEPHSTSSSYRRKWTFEHEAMHSNGRWLVRLSPSSLPHDSFSLSSSYVPYNGHICLIMASDEKEMCIFIWFSEISTVRFWVFVLEHLKSKGLRPFIIPNVDNNSLDSPQMNPSCARFWRKHIKSPQRSTQKEHSWADTDQ